MRVFQKAQYLPLLLTYIKDWETEDEGGTISGENNERDFLSHLIKDSFEYFMDKGKIGSILLMYRILKENEIFHEVFKNSRLFRKILIESMVKSLKNQEFYDFLEGKEFYNSEFGNVLGDIDNLMDLILAMVIESLKSGDFFKIKYAIEHFIEENYLDMSEMLSDETIKKKLEENFYLGLSKSLQTKQFESFKQLLEYSGKFDIFLDVKRIPDRFDHISNLLLGCIQTLSLGGIIKILRFCKEYNLLETEISEDERERLQGLKKDKILMANLRDLFGTVPDSFLLYVREIMPKDLYEYFINDGNFFSTYSDPMQIVNTVMMYFDRYSIYGLSVEKLGTVDRFLRKFEQAWQVHEKKGVEDRTKLIEFKFLNRTHLVSVDNIEKNLGNILDRHDYNFYSLSMVLLGGLGPQGHGFTYSTPQGEVIEICSDIKENEAIIIKYKQFLKQQFLARLRREMSTYGIQAEITHDITSYLSEFLKEREKISYYKKEAIIKQVESYLVEDPSFQAQDREANRELMKKISNAITVILRPIQMEDQFKCRMELVSDDKIQSEDIAKLTSLKQKSHYDVLRERCFFQYVVDWFYERYSGARSTF